MSQAPKHPLFFYPPEVVAALVNACGRVFAQAYACDSNATLLERDRAGAQSVKAFLDTLPQ